MAGGAVLVQKEEERQGAIRAAVSAAPASPLSWALGTITALKGALVAMKVENALPAANKWVIDKQTAFDVWLKQQPIAVDAAVSAGLAALQGAAAGGLVSALNKDLANTLEASGAQRAAMGMGPNATKNPFLSPEGLVASPMVQARNFAVFAGTNAGISCVLKRVRGVDDAENGVAAAFGSGFVFQLVSSTGAPNIAGAVGTGALCALAQLGWNKLSEMMSKEKGTTMKKHTKEDVYYAMGRSMLTRLGLEMYEKNFREGMLTDATLPLLTESALQDVRIPPGPRLVILDHIHRDTEVINGTQSN